jgi:diaminopimelate epimerase
MKFYKLHGAGNDFIFLAGSKTIPKEKIVQFCDRNFGIGADGVIIITKLRCHYDFRMKYFNSDGSEADFCANGGRCAVRLAHTLNFFKGNKCTFIAGDGEHFAEILSDGNIKLQMKRPEGYAKGLKFKKAAGEFFFLNTGVEHTVGFFKIYQSWMWKSSVERSGMTQDIPKEQMSISFKNQMNYTLKIRTYERGVEGETRACGTGITATGYLDMMLTDDFSKESFY